MSAALTMPPSPASPSPLPSSSSTRGGHPIPLREQAFALHCQGLRSPAIAKELGVPERTVRAWIAADLKDLAEEQRATRREQLALAVERQHAITASAWREFETETATRHALLDTLLATLSSIAQSHDTSGPSSASMMSRLPTSTPAPRYLSLIIQANKEIARLLGLYTLARLDLLTPDTPESALAPLADFAILAESATASGSPLLVSERSGERLSEAPAESATAQSGLAAGLQPATPDVTAPSPLHITPRDSVIPAESATATGRSSTKRPPDKRMAARLASSGRKSRRTRR